MRAQTVAQYAVTSGTTLSTAVIATGGVAADGDTYKPTIAGTTLAHRDAAFVTNGATLALASGGSLAVQNDDNLTAFLRVGYGDNQSGTLTIANGATLSVGQASRYANFQIAQGQGATGVVQQTGGNVTVKGSLNVGVNGGTGTYTLSGGNLTIDHADDGGHTSLATIGYNDLGAGSGASSGTLTVSGGTLTVTAHLWDPAGHPGQYGSTELILGNRKTNATSYGAGDGTLTQTGGIVHVDNPASLYLSSVGNGIYNLNGGTLEIGGTSLQANYGNGGGTYAFNFGGGTIKVIGSDLATSVGLNLVSGSSSLIDTNGFNATLSGNLTADGTRQIDYGGNALTKLGSGLLTLSGSSRTLDTFAVYAGSVRQTAGASTAVEFMVGTGTGGNGSFVMDGGTFTVNASVDTSGNPVAGSMRVGDFSGTGTFTQNAGTVTVTSNGALNIGNQGGTGTYNLTGGALNLQGGLNILGRSQTGKPISQGTLNVSGGTLTLQNSSSLVLGNNFSGTGVQLGTGTVNQTGGTVTVANDSHLYLSGYGAGTYTLSGGTLAIGGSSLVAHYSSPTSIYAFNYGAGTIKVTGSSLVTNANLTLQPTAGSTASVFDTNSYDATLSGNITTTGTGQAGAGGNGLFKIGAGTLNLTGSSRAFNTFGALVGTVAQSTGATTATEFMVGSGTGNTGSFVLNGGSLTVDPTLNGSTLVSNGSLRVGDYGGTGTFTQNAGTVTVDSPGALNIGNQGGAGTYNLAGGSLVLQGGLNTLGRSDTTNLFSQGTLNVSAGTLTLQNSSKLILGNNLAKTGSTGTVNQTDGTVHVAGDSSLYLTGSGTGTYNLKGGTLEIGGTSLQALYSNGVAGTYAFNFGGTSAISQLTVTGSNLTTAANITLQPTSALTPAVLNTNGFDATLSGNITTTGVGQEGVGGNGFRKTGTGILNFTGASRAFNTFGVMGGSVAQSTGATTATEFMVGTGTGTSGSFVLNGGSITINPTLDGSGNLVTVGSLRTGDYGGTGTFTQNAGTVTTSSGAAFHIGNQGGTGVYNLNGGTLTLVGNDNVLGRSTGSNPQSTGTLNIAGGSFQLQGAGLLILGNNASGAAAGTGTINQTAGTVTVANDSYLYLSGFGSGTYNLNGGTLAVGGSSLQPHYSTSSSAYALNLGGGTIKVTGADLSAPFNATLSNATTSTLNTNGLNATWSGALSGGGGLTKTGSGTLNLTNTANSYSGATTVSGGTLNLTGKLLNSTVIVGNGGTLRGSGSAANVTVQSGGLFSPGAGVGTFTVDGNLSLLAGSTTLMEINGLDRGTGYDFLTAASVFTFGGTLNLSLGQGLTLAAGDSFDLFDWGTTAGTFAALHLPSPGSALGWDTSQLYTTGVLSVQVSAIPEPATVSLLAGLAGLGFAAYGLGRKRRRARGTRIVRA